MTGGNEQPTIWAIRYTRWAVSDVSAAWFHFAESADEETADAWDSGLKAEIAKLAQYPERFSLQNWSDIFTIPVRKMIYRRTRRGPAYHVFFTLQTSPDDAPTVLVMHIRHAAKAPLTRREAREIEASE